MTTYSGNCTDCVEIGTPGMVESLIQRIQHWVRMQGLKASLLKERQQLLEMSDSMLRDIGIIREQAYAEAQCVDVPGNRLKGMEGQA